MVRTRWADAAVSSRLIRGACCRVAFLHSQQLCVSLRTLMKTLYTVTLAMLAGVGVGAAAVQTLHAQGKPPVYTVTEIDVTNIDAYTKEYAPLAQASIKSS